jgi:hypothetical protein
MRTPLAAFGYGLVAGALGAGVQSLFFKATARITPKPPKDAFEPPEKRQRSEPETVTVARRAIEGMMKRPASARALERGGTIVHHAFGALWGAAYGLARESLGRRPGPLWVAGYSTLVWAVSDNLLLPIFRIAAWPSAYPIRSHAYALAAHFAYGGGVFVAYETLRNDGLAGAAIRFYLDTRRERRLPPFARPLLRPAQHAMASVRRAVLPALAAVGPR